MQLEQAYIFHTLSSSHFHEKKNRDLLFMPVKYLMNVPKNNFVFSLHVLLHTFGAHCGHVALQKGEKAAVVS